MAKERTLWMDFDIEQRQRHDLLDVDLPILPVMSHSVLLIDHADRP
jgi:hypothetical protein